MNKPQFTAEEKKRLQTILEATNDHDLARKLGVAQKTARPKKPKKTAEEAEFSGIFGSGFIMFC